MVIIYSILGYGHSPVHVVDEVDEYEDEERHGARLVQPRPPRRQRGELHRRRGRRRWRGRPGARDVVVCGNAAVVARRVTGGMLTVNKVMKITAEDYQKILDLDIE